MHRSQVFYFLLISFILGIFARSFFEIPSSFIFALTIFSIAAMAIFFSDRKILFVCSFALMFCFGIFWADREIEKVRNLPLVGKELKGKAIIQKVSSNSFGQNIIARFSDQKISVLLQIPQYPEYEYGDELSLSCGLKEIKNKNSDFNYQMYMAKEGVFYACENKKIEETGEGKGNQIYSLILKIRKSFEKNINKIIPFPESALANGLLFGGGSQLPKEIQNEFSKTGMTHIVAVSGYNVTIIAEYLMIIGIAIGLWRKKAIWFAIFGIAIFVIMSGFPASAVRAGVMGSTLLWAMKHGRLSNSENAIIFAGAVMLILNPLLLRWDVGFELSFLATIGIVKLSPFWENIAIKKHKALGITEMVAMSISAQIFVLPIIAYNFQITSLISLLANVFILPIIPISMLLVFLTALLGFAFSWLSMIFAWLSFAFLLYELKLIHVLAQFPWASVSFEKFTPTFVAIYYLILFILIFQLEKYFSNKNRCETEK